MNNLKTVFLHNKAEIEQFLLRNTFLHLYSIGDLDDFFWENTTWYALKHDTQIEQVALLYTGLLLPTLLALTDETTTMANLLQSIIHLLPKQFYAHLSDGLVSVLNKDYASEHHGLHYKMALRNRECLKKYATDEVIQLTIKDIDEIEELYRVSYPGNWFDSRMLETGYYYGIRRENRLVSIAGVHVYSKRYNVAALGNITTHPQFRGQGLSKHVIAKLCQELAAVQHIGLNVKADNAIALRCYQQIGFECVATYNEYSFLLQ